MTIWLHFLSYGSNRSAALPGTRAFGLAYSSRSLCQRFHTDHGSGSAPQYVKTLLISCPSNDIPALSAVNIGRIRCSLSICFLDVTVYVSHHHITNMIAYLCKKFQAFTPIKMGRVAFPPRYKYRTNINSFNFLILVLRGYQASRVF